MEGERNMNNKAKNAEWLGIMAVINLVICILATIAIWVAPFILEEEFFIFEDKGGINVPAVILGIGVLISGFTQYFLLKTIQDIYYKIKK